MNSDIHILIVEDEELFASKMEMQIDKLGHICAGIADNSKDALLLIEEHPVSLILMDINITGDYDGIELAEMISKRRNIPILFVTSNHDDLSFNRATRAGAQGFIVKPFSDIQLQRAIELALKQLASTEKAETENGNAAHIEDGYIFIKKNSNIFKVLIEDIYYLEADGRYCRVYTKNEMYLIRHSLKVMKESLATYSFIQCHRSYVINISKVKSVDLEDDVVIMEERSVPLSRREKDTLLERLNYLK